jgi:hypothetical protein
MASTRYRLSRSTGVTAAGFYDTTGTVTAAEYRP